MRRNNVVATIVIAVCCFQTILLLISTACFFLSSWTSWGNDIENAMVVITKIAGAVFPISIVSLISKFLFKLKKVPLWLVLTSLAVPVIVFLQLFIVYSGRHY